MQGVSQSISCSVDAQGVYLTLFTFVNAGLPDYPALVQSGTVMNEDASTGTSPVPVRNKGIPCGAGIRGLIPVRNAPGPDCDTGCRNADAGGIGLDADAQL
jgi:hypothetical protein